jgi:ferric-dicitrate binding protein FerR (iron transport regulator)
MQKQECIILFERYIRNQATDEEIKRLSGWLRNNPAISLWLEQQVLSSSSEINIEVQMKMLNVIRRHISDNNHEQIMSNKEPKKYFSIKKWLRVAAVLIFPLLTAAAVYVYMSNVQTESAPLIIAAERGQKANIVLPDGSRVWLNSQSKLTCSPDYNKRKRVLQLDGEAYFEVAKMENKVFIVQTGGGVYVEALGTAFGVKAYSEVNLISSVLISGKIRVTTPAGSSVLLPKDRLVYDKTNQKTAQNKVINAADFNCWINDELRFENESLDEIAKTIQRIYNVEFVFASEKLKNMRYTGTVDNTSLESVLHIITLTSPVSVLIDKNRIVFYKDEKLMKHYNP